MNETMRIEIDNLKCGGCEASIVTGLPAGLANAKSCVNCAIGRFSS